MPRYRFSWDNVDGALLDALCGEAPADESSAEVLRRVYGARPKEDFVAVCWPVLRERWLTRADGPRAEVSAALRRVGLGDLTIVASGPEDQMAFLRSCPNRSPLRKVVLAAFVEAGGQPAMPTKPAPEPPSWETFSSALATVLGRLAPEQCLIVSVRGTGTEHEDDVQGAPHFVQFAQQGPDGFRAEAVSNAYLVGRERLTPDQQVQLVRLGWLPPTHAPGDPRGEHDPGGSSNHYRDWDQPAPYDEVAAMAVATLREVYGVASPALLSYFAFDGAGRELSLPELAIEQEHAEVDAPHLEALLPQPGSTDELREALEATLVEAFDWGDIVRDPDGDIPIQSGSAVVFVRVLPGAPIVRVFAPVLSDVQTSPALLEAVNEINATHSFVRAVFDNGTVTLVIDVQASPYVGAHVLQAIGGMAAVADEVDDELADRFGGRTFFAERSRAAREDTAGYL